MTATPQQLDPTLRATLTRLFEEGGEIWDRFDRETRSRRWHSFVPGDYERVLECLLALRRPGLRFLEWGSATGVIAITADLLGYEAFGIELDEGLVGIARELGARYGSGAVFAAGSFLPTGYAWRPRDGDARTGTVGVGISGYMVLGHPLDDFDLVYGYPWDGEEPLMHDIMRAYGATEAELLLHGVSGEMRRFRRGRLVPWQAA